MIVVLIDPSLKFAEQQYSVYYPFFFQMRKVAGRIPNLIVRDSGYTDEDMLNYEET